MTSPLEIIVAGGSLDDWSFCPGCGALRPPRHRHGDPYDPDPRPLEPATNGFIRCPACERVVSLPHECDVDPGFEAAPTSSHSSALARAEYAESLLSALAFDHARLLRHLEDLTVLDPPWHAGCVFCVKAGRPVDAITNTNILAGIRP